MANKMTVADKKKKAWQMYCEGFSLRAIGKELKVSHVQVKKYIDPLLNEWLHEHDVQLDEIKKRELLKLDNWDKRIARVFNSNAGKDKEEKIAEEIRIRLQIHKQRARLLGLEKIVFEGTNKNWDMTQFSDEELLEIASGVSPEFIIKRRNEFGTNTGKGNTGIKKT